MSKVVDFLPPEERLEKAGEWLMLLDERTLSADEQAEFKLWLDSSHLNLTAFQEVARLWGKMEILAGMADLFPLDPLENYHSAPRLQNKELKKSSSISWTRAVAASFIVAFISVFAFKQYVSLTSIEPGKHHYVTEIGETETIDLEDGSVITANTNSELRVDVNDNERRIELTRGEAFFEVEHDPERPFTVYAGNGYVRAVGTAFSVYKHGDKVEVIVTEGSVEVVPDEYAASLGIDPSPGQQPLLLESGQVAEYDRSVELLEEVDSEELSRQLFWKQGMLAFEGQSLEEVIDEFSRYTTTNIQIVNDDIREIRVGGYFQSDDLNGMLAALESNFGIKVTEVNSSLVHLSLQ